MEGDKRVVPKRSLSSWVLLCQVSVCAYSLALF